MGKILAVCSGNGGAGKSTVALSLAVGAAKRGKDTILLDASGFSRACDLMLGIESVVILDLLDVARQQASIHSALYQVPGREHLQFACASLYEDGGASISELSGVLLALRAMSDVVVIDMPTGQASLPDEVLTDSDALILLAVPNDASIRAAERLIANLGKNDAQRYLMLNRVHAGLVKKRIQYDKRSVEMMLDMPASALIAEDERIQIECKKGKAALETDGRIAAEFFSLLNEVL